MPTTPGNCDEDTVKNNLAQATQLGKGYLPVEVKRVTMADAATRTLTFLAQGTDGNDHEFRLRWGDLNTNWPFCPSSLPSSAVYPDAGPLPAVGSAGVLYVEQAATRTLSVRGGTPKWPVPLEDPPLTALLPVAADHLILTGVEQAKNGVTSSGTVDLMDRNMAPPQTLVIGNGVMQLRLTQAGFGEFNVNFPAQDHLREAIQIIHAKKNPRLIVEAWKIVDACHTLVQEGRTDVFNKQKLGGVDLDQAKSLISEVLHP